MKKSRPQTAKEMPSDPMTRDAALQIMDAMKKSGKTLFHAAGTFFIDLSDTP